MIEKNRVYFTGKKNIVAAELYDDLQDKVSALTRHSYRMKQSICILLMIIIYSYVRFQFIDRTGEESCEKQK